MNRIFIVMAALIVMLAPAVSYAQDSSLQSSVSASSGMESSVESEESRAASRTDSEIAWEEASGQRQMDIMDQSMAGNSTSQMTAAEQADSN